MKTILKKARKIAGDKKQAETIANQEDTIRQLQELLDSRDSNSWNETDIEDSDDNRRPKKVRSNPTGNAAYSQARAKKIADLKKQLEVAEEDDIAENTEIASAAPIALSTFKPFVVALRVHQPHRRRSRSRSRTPDCLIACLIVV